MKVKLNKARFILASILAVVMSVIIAVPAMADVNLGVSSPSCSATNPWKYDLETNKTYYPASGEWRWTGYYGFSFSIKSSYPPITVDCSIVESDTITDGYTQLPIEYASITPSTIEITQTGWYNALVTLDPPDEPQYYGQHFQLEVNFLASDDDDILVSSKTLYFITEDAPEGKFTTEENTTTIPIVDKIKTKLPKSIKKFITPLRRIWR